uniref:Uncharacterized protein n=1 Tax=Brassica oleracea var. oleracea TaxID=109376 RepID=A0A0D3A9X0_BRAOL
MKRGFLGSSKKESADSRTIHKSTREESIDTLQAASIDIVNQTSNDTNQLVSDNTVQHGTVHRITVHVDTIHPVSIDTVHLPSIDTVHPASIDTVHPVWIETVHPNTVHCNTVLPGTVHPNTVYPDTVHPVKNNTTCGETEKIEVLILKLLDAFMAKKDEQHVSGELSRVEEAGTEDATSTSTDGKTSTSTDITTSTSTDITTSMSTDITTSTSTDITTSTSIDGSTQKSTDVSSCDLIPNVDIKITMEDFLELEDEAQPQNLEHNLEKKLDEYQHTSEKDLETSKASIARHQPDEIDRQPPHIIDLHPPDIDRHRQPLIDRHHTLNIDRCPLLDVQPCCIIEMEPIEERTYMSKASHLAIVVPCAVVEVESPIPSDRIMQLSHYIGVLDDPLHAEASQRGLLFRDEVDKSPSEAALIDTDQIPSIDATTSPSIDTGRVS